MKHSSLSFRLLACALLALATVPLQAQTIYRIVGPDGKVTFSDRAPGDATKATASTAAGKPLNTGEPGLPYELRQIVSRYPVTLYSGTSCAPCNAGRILLQSRGIPFTEYSVTTSDDTEALQRISGDNSLPFLTVGGQKIKGYSEAEWVQFLNAANYPMTSLLPANYRNPPAKALVATQKPATPQTQTEASASSEDKSAAGQPGLPPAAAAPATAVNPGGIRF